MFSFTDEKYSEMIKYHVQDHKLIRAGVRVKTQVCPVWHPCLRYGPIQPCIKVEVQNNPNHYG